ncbi:hypothetical protein CPC08DRAFT_727239 [Agrocybe pediades]|nr:hypothetical protein CPC08DRAFT_727239 [Agrocybe pediades]
MQLFSSSVFVVVLQMCSTSVVYAAAMKEMAPAVMMPAGELAVISDLLSAGGASRRTQNVGCVNAGYGLCPSGNFCCPIGTFCQPNKRAAHLAASAALSLSVRRAAAPDDGVPVIVICLAQRMPRWLSSEFTESWML